MTHKGVRTRRMYVVEPKININVAGDMVLSGDPGGVERGLPGLRVGNLPNWGLTTCKRPEICSANRRQQILTRDHTRPTLALVFSVYPRCPACLHSCTISIPSATFTREHDVQRWCVILSSSSRQSMQIDVYACDFFQGQTLSIPGMYSLGI